MSATAAVAPAVRGSAGVRARDLGVRFAFDRHHRVVTPGLSHVRRTIDAVWALDGVDLAIQPGEAVAVVGPTGSGKTTLLRAIAGVVPADRGELDVRGRVGSLLSTEGGLMGGLTGRENGRLLMVLAGVPLARATAGLEGLRARSGLGEAFERLVSTYSEGMRARLGFAAAAAAAPQIVVLDEVFEALDHEYRQVVESHARELCAGGGVVIAAGHDHEELERMCSRAVLLSEGRVRADGPFADVIATYRG
jgi:ABC-type polysaccharide/polyol phosphate transport system ATPase subunit